MEANQLMIINVQGSVRVVLDDGSIKTLNAGDLINIGDLIVTGTQSSISIDVQGETLSIEANQSVRITPDLLAKEIRDPSETTVFDESIDEALASLNSEDDESGNTPVSSEVSNFLDALEGNGDLLDNLEATAAGGNGVSGAGGGNSFVQLTRIIENIDANALTFNTNFEQEVNESFNLANSSDGVLPDSVIDEDSISSITLNDLSLVNPSQPIISGTSENLVGQTVNVTVTDVSGNIQIVSVVIDPDGRFEIALPDPVADGPVTIVVDATDNDGNPVNSSISVNVDTTAPIITIDSVADSASPIVTITGSVSGLNTGDNITIVVTGSDGSVENIVTQVDEAGNWSITTSEPLSEGEFSINATATDAAGNQAQNTRVGLVDLTNPEITVTEINDTNDTTPTISGRVEGTPAGSQITVVVTDSNNNEQTLTTTLNSDGTWSVETGNELSEGLFSVLATVADPAGNTATSSETGEIDLTSPIININTLGDNNDSTPTIIGSVEGVSVGTVITLTVTDADGIEQTITTQIQESGSWSVDVANPLANGNYSVQASVTDNAGNEGVDTATGSISILAVVIDDIGSVNEQMPTISGSALNADVGAVINVEITDANDQVVTLTTTVDASGEWRVTPNVDLAEGRFTVNVQVIDSENNTASTSLDGIIDITPPTIEINDIAASNDITPVISGSALGVVSGSSINLTVTDSQGVVRSFSTTVDSNGDWSLELDQALSSGNFTVKAQVSDVAGNTVTDTKTGEIDTTSPDLTVNFSNNTNDATPTFSGTSDGVAGTEVVIVITDQNGTEQVLTAVINAGGMWEVTPVTPLADGEYTVEVSVEDALGNRTVINDSLTIDTQPATLTIQNIGDVNDTTPLLQGTSSEKGKTVTIKVSDSAADVKIYTAIVDSNGHWSVEITDSLAQGNFTVEAKITDDFNNEVIANETGNVDTVIPELDITAPGLGNDNTPIINGTSSEPEGAIVSVVILDSNNDEHLVTTTVDSNGQWQVTSPELPDGNYSINASIKDSAGNTGGALQVVGNIDTTEPGLTLNHLGATNDNTPIISGQSNEPAGSIITIKITDEAMNSEIFNAMVQSDGSWSAESPNALNDGELTIEVTSTDKAGNTTTVSETAILNTHAVSLSINTLANSNDTTPTISGTSDAANGEIVTLSITDSAGNVFTGISAIVSEGQWSVEIPATLAEGSYTVDASITVSGVNTTTTEIGIIDLTAPVLTVNNNDENNDTTPTISGTVTGTADDNAQGSIVTIIVTDSNSVSHTITTSVAGNGEWSVATSQELSEGSYTFLVSVTDVAGNTSTATGSGEVDITAPTLTINVLNDSNSVTPIFSGESDADEGTVISFTVIDALGDTQNFTATVDINGQWSVTVPNDLAEGEYTVKGSITDSAGNITTINSAGNIDISPPEITINAPLLTNDSTPLVTGTSSESNSTITVSFVDINNISHSIDVQTDSSGNWSVEATHALAEGNYTVTASMTDTAGNIGTNSDFGVIDLTAPELRIIPSFGLGNLISLSGESDLPAGSTITITEYLVGGAVGATYTATTNSSGAWTVLNITVPLLNLAYVTATAMDEAGNVATVNSLDFDNVAPTLTVNIDALSNDTTPLISGTTDMASGTEVKIKVTDDDNQVQTFTATVQADNTWSVSVPNTLAQGEYTVVVEVRDEVGNLTTIQDSAVVDSVAPTLNTSTLDDSKDNTPTLSGNSTEIGATVAVIIDGQILSATVDIDGHWEVTVPEALADGDYTAQISIEDEAKNISQTTIDVTIDTTIPIVTLSPLTQLNTNTPTIEGTSEEPQGTIVDVVITDSNNDTHTVTAIVDANGDWQVVSPQLPEGSYSVNASITDDAGNTASNTALSLVDTLAPTISINTLGTINNSTPTISGTSNEAQGVTITVTVTDINGSTDYNVITGEGGAWSVDTTTVLVDGNIGVSASITDNAGNTSQTSTTGVLNTSAPTITITPLFDSNDQTPVISGTSSALDGTSINIVITGEGGAVENIVTTVINNIWSVTASNTISEGTYEVKAEVTEAGLTSSTTSSGVIDLTPPTLSITPVDVTNDTTPTISGSSNASQGSIVNVVVTDSLGSTQNVSATVGANGGWSVALITPLVEGTYSVDTSVSDSAGNTSNAASNISIDTTAPIVGIDPIVSNQNLMPIISGTSTGAVLGDSVTVLFTDNLGNTHSVNTTIELGGTWQVTATQALSQGEYTIDVSVIDSAGNTGQSDMTGLIDTIAPEININQSSLILTQDSTPLISGTSSEANTSITVTFTDSDNATVQVVVQTDSNGDWQAVPSSILADGAYSVSVAIADPSENTSNDTKTGGEVDTVGPDITIAPSFLLGGLLSLSGTSDLGAGKIVTVTEYLASGLIGATHYATTDANGDWTLIGVTINILGLASVTASAVDDAGNITIVSTANIDSTPAELDAIIDYTSGQNTPTISGTTDLDEGSQVVVEVIDSDNVVQSLTTTVQAGGSWAILIPQTLIDGIFSVTVSVLNDVGLTTSKVISGIVDTISPTLTLELIGTTSDSSPIIQGLSDLINGVVTVNVDGQILNATVNALGYWSVEVSALAEGAYVAEVSITDSADNETIKTLAFVVDFTAPIISILPLSLGNTDILTLSGESEEGEGSQVDITIIDSNGDKHFLTALVDSDGKWSIQSLSLPDGNYNVIASMTDSAGQTSTVTTTGIIDTLSPILTINELGILNVLTPIITGTSNEPEGSEIAIKITDVNNTIYNVTATVLLDGTWSVVADELPEGMINIEVTSTDEAGNETTITQDAIISTTLPSLQINPIGDTNDTTPLVSGSSNILTGTVSVVITDSNGDENTYTTNVIAGLWSLSPTIALAIGEFSVDVTITNTLGVSSTTSLIGNIDLTSPTIEINDLSITNDAMPTISGTSDATAGTEVVVVFVDANNVSHQVSAVVLSNGTWSAVASQALGEGYFTVTASVSDEAGNSSSDNLTIQADYTAPIILIDTLGTASDATPTITGSVTGSVTGVAASTLIFIEFTDKLNATHTVQTTIDSNGDWSVEAGQIIADGIFNINVSVSDSAGNITEISTSGVVDTLASQITIDSGLALTSDNTPNITGTTGAGETVIVTFDNGTSQHTKTTTANESGVWSVSSQTLVDGSYVVSATTSDSAGNTNTSGSLNGLVIDTTPIDFSVSPNYLLNVLGVGILTGYEGTASGPAGTKVYIVDSLVLGLDVLLTSAPYAVVDAYGNWDSANLDLNALGLLGTGLENTYFFTVDDAGNYLVKNGNNEIIDFESAVSLAQSSALGDEFLAEPLEGAVSSAGQSIDHYNLGNDAINLGNVDSLTTLSSQKAQVATSQALTIDDVLLDSESIDLVTINITGNNEMSAIVYNQSQNVAADLAAPATGIQNQSEEMIKLLIESNANQTDV